MKRRLNGSYQGKRAMRRARQKAKCKRQIRNRPNYNQENEIFQIVFISILGFFVFLVLYM
jgi:hypothetical protein